MHRSQLLLLLMFFSLGKINAQGLFEKQLPKHIYEESVVDSTYGIMMYENLVAALGGDSIRKNGVYACNGWFEDAYKNGQILHKGYYSDGQLQSYKNYYPNGKMEREFNSIDAMFGEAKIYYDNGQLKSQVKYSQGSPSKWTDYYRDGKLQYEEKMNKTLDYYEYQKYYYTSGTVQKETVLKDKKKLEFVFTEYYPSGAVKVKGTKLFIKEGNSYMDHGEWKYFDESGSVSKTEKYDRGVKL